MAFSSDELIKENSLVVKSINR